MKRLLILIGSTLLGVALLVWGARGFHKSMGLPSDKESTALVRVDLSNGQVSSWLKVPGTVQRMALSPQGSELAVLSSPSDPNLKEWWLLIWRFPDGTFLRRLTLPSLPFELSWQDDHTLLVGGGSEPVQVLDSQSGKCLRELPPIRIGLKAHPSHPWVASLLSDGKESKGHATVTVRNIHTGGLEFETKVQSTGPGETLGWTRDGAHLYVANGKGVSLWSSQSWKSQGTSTRAQLETGGVKQLEATFAHGLAQQVSALAWQSNEALISRDGKWVLRQGPGDVNTTTLELIDANTPALLRIWETYRDPRQAFFDPSGRWLVLPEASPEPSDAPLGSIHIEGPLSQKRWQGHMGAVESLDVDPQGRWIVSGGQDWNIHLWNATTGTRIKTFGGSRSAVETVRIAADGAWLASRAEGEPTIRIWNVASGRMEKTLDAPKAEGFDHFQFHPGRPWLLVPGPQGVGVWDVTTGDRVRILPQVPPSDRAMAFSPDGSQLALLGKEGISILDAATLEPLFNLPSPTLPVAPPSSPDDAGYSPEVPPFKGGHLVYSVDGTRLWWSSPWVDGGDIGWGALWELSSRRLLESGETLAHPDTPHTKDFPLRRDPYSDQHAGTPDGRIKVHGTGFEAGC